MDKLILGIVNCDQPSQVKGAFLEKIAIAAADGDENKGNCFGVIRACLQILYPNSENSVCLPKDALVDDRVQRILISWVENKLQFTLQYIQEILCNCQLKDFSDLWMKCQNIRMLGHILNVVRGMTTTGHTDFRNNVSRYVLQEFFVVDNLSLVSIFSETFLQNPELLSNSPQDEMKKIIHFLVKIVARGAPTNSNQEKKPGNISCIEPIAEFFKKCIDADIAIMKHAAGSLFKEISNHIYKPCINLAMLLNHLRYDDLSSCLDDVLVTVPDLSVACILIQLLDWFSVTIQDGDIQSWIMHMIKFLASHEKFNILDPVIATKVDQVCKMIYNPSHRIQAVTVLAYMLMSCSKNPNSFHKVLADLPALLVHLNGDSNRSATQTLQILSELLFTLMYNFPDSSGIYEALNAALKGQPKPDVQTMKLWLSNFRFANNDASVETMDHLEAVETGLTNLGNTCYMNSVVQALYNLVCVKRKILSVSYRSILHPVSVNLQNVFAYLHLSKRPSIEPSDLIRVSRPNWFQSGSQQDCSEYLKHLLDRLNQEDEDVDKIDSFFNGEIDAIVECLHCHSRSCQKEAFNDLPLSFKHSDCFDVSSSSLKGGDSSDVLESKKVKFQLDDNKENLKSSLECSPSRTSPDILIPENSGVSVVDLINNYFMPELLKEANQYFCDVCSSLQDASKSMKISKFPKYLIITLKRFTYNVITKKRSKILDIVQYPPIFSVCNGCESCFETGGMEGNTVTAFTSPTNCQVSKVYRISSVIVHSGMTSDSGHYYTYTCRYMGDKCSWYLSNDEQVCQVSDNCIANLSSNNSCDTPYVCIYEECQSGDNLAPISLPESLENMVFADNNTYQQERLATSKKTNISPILTDYDRNRKDMDDDDANGPPGSCNSGGGSTWGGARFVC